MKAKVRACLKRVLYKLVAMIIPLRNYIMFESVPDLGDNALPVFLEMLSRGMDKQYRFVWRVSDKQKNYPKYSNTIYVDGKTLLGRIRLRYYMACSKCLISCNNILIPFSAKQCAIYLTHGTALKSVKSYYTLDKTVDYMVVASEASKEVMANEFNYDINRCVALGFPRNDALITANKDVRPLFDTEFNKIVVWYPTFRQHKNGKKLTESRQGLPLIYNIQNAILLDEVARNNNVLIVIKPHFAQDISYIQQYDLKNLRFIDDSFFEKNGLSSYEFVGSCDAMITDYSSIYFDYLLCDKPIAAVCEDIDEYREKPGFAVDPDYFLKGAHKVYTIDDLCVFISNVADGNDQLKNARAEICRWANCSDIPDNTKRVTDFIINKLNEDVSV